ncbi:MAG: hypothetical protein ACOYOH_09010 [Paracraurococcus sp.]
MEPGPREEMADPTEPPHAAARGILLAVLLSSVFWIGLAITLFILL